MTHWGRLDVAKPKRQWPTPSNRAPTQEFLVKRLINQLLGRTSMSVRRRPLWCPDLMVLEDRCTPSIAAALSHGSLIVSGTSDAGPAEAVTVRHVGADRYQVLDGTDDRGTFRVTRDLRVQLDSAAAGQVVRVDLAGDTLTGDLTARVGSGRVVVEVTNSAAAAARVNGNVKFTGGAGDQTFLLTPIYSPGASEPAASGTIEVRGDVRADSASGAGAGRDRLELGPNTTVREDVTARGVATVQVEGSVGGNVTSDAADTPGGAYFLIEGPVGGNVRAVAGSAPNDGFGFSGFLLDGAVGGNTSFHLTRGNADVTVAGPIGGNFTYAGAEGTSSGMFLIGDTAIGGSAVISYGGGEGTVNAVEAWEVDVEGSFVVINRGGGLTDVWLGIRYHTDPETGQPVPRLPSIGGGLVIALTGAGAENYVTLDLAPGSAPVGVFYAGGSGADYVMINGQNSYRAVVLTGGGNDTVEFAPDARVGAALIDFGTLPGEKVFVPPDTVDFPLVVRNYP
jgi:hypothetical protein